MPYKNKEDKKKHDKEYREKNREKIREIKSLWREKNREKIREDLKDRWANKDKNYYTQQEYREKNKEKIKEYAKQYYIKNKQKLLSDSCARRKKRKEIDPMFKVNCQISSAIYNHLIRENLHKNNRHWETIVGYTIQELVNHLESLFKEGMTWDNYGSYWHIDHIRPKSWFVFESMDDPAFKECWALSNLQPLEAHLNIMKRDRWEG